MKLVDIIFVFCAGFSDQIACYDQMVNCVITKDKVTHSKIQQCKEKTKDENSTTATGTNLGSEF